MTEHEAVYDIAVSEAEAARMLGGVAGIAIVSQTLVVPALREITGRKLRRLPVFFGTMLLWNFLVGAPAATVRRFRSEREEQEAIDRDLENFLSDLNQEHEG